MRPYLNDILEVQNQGQNQMVTATSGQINLQFVKERIDN